MESRGAYFARPSIWKKWTKDWNLQKRPIKVFHSSECNAREGESKGWDRPRRDAYVIALLPVITRYPLLGGRERYPFGRLSGGHEGPSRFTGDPRRALRGMLPMDADVLARRS